jgi:hypothetical protein
MAALALGGCGGQPQAGTAPDCPAATAGTQLLTNQAHGYCLLYPTGHESQQPNENETVLYIGALLNVQQPRAYIAIEPAGGRTAAQVADALIADVSAALPGLEVKRTSTTVDGEAAIVLDDMPGQDINRQLVMVHGDRLYHLTFAPADHAQMDALYNTVISSFNFLPQ